jgi:hypothetical protein
MPTNPNEVIIINDNGVDIELTGQDLLDFQAMRDSSRLTLEVELAEAQAKVEARQSALAKLAAIGLTQEEIEAL